LNGDWINIQCSVSIDQKTANRPNAEGFLKGTPLYILGTRCGGNITLP